MKPPSYEEAPLLPLVTDSDVQERVEQLIGRAYVRQLWLLFVDEFDVQLPLMIPIDGLPAHPDDDGTDLLIERVRDVMEMMDATSIIVVQEREGSDGLAGQDIEWARSLRGACASAGIALRAQLIAHRTGVRWIAADDRGMDDRGMDDPGR